MNRLINVMADEVEIVIKPMTIITAVIVCLVVAALLGLLLSVASKFLKVEQDERIYTEAVCRERTYQFVLVQLDGE